MMAKFHSFIWVLPCILFCQIVYVTGEKSRDLTSAKSDISKNGPGHSSHLFCDEGTYKHITGECRYCTKCSRREKLISACTSTEDAVCKRKKRRKKIGVLARCTDFHKRRHHGDLQYKMRGDQHQKQRNNQKCSLLMKKIFTKMFKSFKRMYLEESKNRRGSVKDRSVRMKRAARKRRQAGKKGWDSMKDGNTTLDDEDNKFMSKDFYRPKSSEVLPTFDSYGDSPIGSNDPVGDNGNGDWSDDDLDGFWSQEDSDDDSSFGSIDARRKKKLRVPTESKIPDDFTKSGSADSSSSSNPVVYILPVIFAVLFISLLATLLMWKIQRKKAASASPKNKADSSVAKSQDSSNFSPKEEDEAVELVDFVQYHPAHERKLLSGYHENDFETREPLMSLHHQRSSDEITAGFAQMRYERDPGKVTQSTSKVLNNELRMTDSRSTCATEDEMDPLEKIYISIPPRPPSDNYIEAASTNTSVSSSKSITDPKLEWLTKTTMVDAKNEACNYQSDISTQTVPNVEAVSSKTVFGTPWQFGGTFTNDGGVLQRENSDVCLTLVPKSVRSKEYVDIYGAIFTETQEICKKFDIPANEMLITPLVEYHAPGNYVFTRHVRISLPHALPEDVDINTLKVYGFSVNAHGEVSLQVVPLRQRDNDRWNENCFWEFGRKDQDIKIWTSHFSGYFCTACEMKSRLPSVCARVFGSHVQIKSRRREIRLILYIWDRRLNIRDYLERIIEQECDMDRQLLADQQIPLPENAVSDSQIIMKMDTLGDEEDRICWRHVMRPNSGRPLFRPLQVRKLFQIIHCCQKSDPLRVEWAMENVPGAVPSSVFQCCIDVLLVSESTTNFEQALEDADEDYMRTFYVRDLTLSGYSQDDEEQTGVSPPAKQIQLKQALSELSLLETESMCEAFGLAKKDIGNLCQKFSTEDKIKHGLLEECYRRVGQEHFLYQLPDVLKQLDLFHVLQVLEKRKLLLTNQKLSQTNMKRLHTNSGTNDPVKQRPDSTDSSTKLKYQLSSGERSGSNSYVGGLNKQLSDQSNDVFFQENNPSNHYGSHQVSVQINYPGDANGNLSPNFPRHSSQRYYTEREPEDRHLLSSHSFSHRAPQDSSLQVTQEQIRKKFLDQKSSSSGSDSVLRGTSIADSDVAMSSLDSTSLEAQADSKEFQAGDKNDELEEYEEETFKKEVWGVDHRETRQGFPEIQEEILASRSGFVALDNLDNDSTLRCNLSNQSNNNTHSYNYNSGHRAHHASQHSNQMNTSYSQQQSGHSHGSDQTFCKESYETIV